MGRKYSCIVRECAHRCVLGCKSPLLNISSAVLHMRKSYVVSDTRGSWQFRNGGILLFRHTNSSSWIESFRKCGNRIGARTERSIVYEPKTVELRDTLTKGRDLKKRLWAIIFLKVTFIIILSLPVFSFLMWQFCIIALPSRIPRSLVITSVWECMSALIFNNIQTNGIAFTNI